MSNETEPSSHPHDEPRSPELTKSMVNRLHYLEAHAAQQAEGIEWLRTEVAIRDEALRKIHQSKLWRAASAYWRVRQALGNALAAASHAARDTVVAPVRLIRKLAGIPEPQPAVSTPNENLLILPSTYDIICFSIIDWDFRWQRPQQMMSRFADAGHRVFYISTTRFANVGGRHADVVRLRENVWEVRVATPLPIDVYSGTVRRTSIATVLDSLSLLRRDFHITCAASIVQVATWNRVAAEARERFGWTLAYDCMDEWNAFPGIDPAMLAEEENLVSSADLLIVSADQLQQKWSRNNENLVLARNAADFRHYENAQPGSLLQGEARPIVGYFGAIAPWFDLDLMLQVATSRPHYTFVLIGGSFDVDLTALAALPNVRILGQRPYHDLPEYLARFDACIIPFVVNEITASTDPVKFYEYMSLGKPVITTEMPELVPYRELLYMAHDADEFARLIDQALEEDRAVLRPRRIALAKENTWEHRIEDVKAGLERAHRRTSLVIVTYENLALTRLCLDSVFVKTLCPNTEVVVVDNDSRDGTRDYLAEVARAYPNVKLIFNEENAGFARANNQGIAVSTGEVIVLLNNDTVVPTGWLERLVRHTRDPRTGLVVAVTNFSGNESRIDVPYTDLSGIEPFAIAQSAQHDGESFDIRVAAMYCVAMRRDVFDRVGPLDEDFRIGMFEDDDYSHRVRLAGYRVVCAEDAFVHHFGQASFKRLSPPEYDAVWKRNQQIFESKWGIRWEPHTSRKT